MRGPKIIIGAVGSLVLACCVYRFIGIVLNVGHQTIEAPVLVVVEAIVLLFCTLLGLNLVHISSLEWSDHLDASSLYLLYLINIVCQITSFFVFKSFEKLTKKFRKTQEKYILNGLRHNQNTIYGKEFHLGDIHSLGEFKTRHPLTTYSHYEKYVDRICAGELNVLTKDEVIQLRITSGTTGKGKKIPYTIDAVWRFSKPITLLAPKCVAKTFSTSSPLRRTLYMFVCPESLPPESGIAVVAGSVIPKSYKNYLQIYSTPISGFDISTEFEACYVHLLFGIRDRFLKSITVLFTPLLITAFKTLETHWEQMLKDIEGGSLWSKLNIPVEVRADLEEKLKGKCNPDRVQFLRREFEKGFDGIGKRIWPKLRVWLGTDLNRCADKLCNTYMKGVAFASERYLGTEGFYGVNLTMLRPPPHRYTLVPDSVLFEFIPIDESEENNPNTYFGDQVKVGQIYELVVSNWTCGLYRFRIGDVIKVVDFYNESPVVEFQYRYGQLLSIRGEKVDEVCMRKALENTFRQFSGITLIEYACAESFLMPDSAKRQGPHYYVVFVEVEGNKGDIGEHISTLLDSELCEHAALYKMWRSQNGIGTADVLFVKPGGFARLKNYIVDNSTATFNQFKQPRKLKTEGTVAFILDQTSD
ncbi:uncharacterized protein [Antedon mediterranea]|uniref:uncharacterized protein n=1 Tax=Antedon mediterranea TaxID=105859 RepID=UPI003AF97801